MNSTIKDTNKLSELQVVENIGNRCEEEMDALAQKLFSDFSFDVNQSSLPQLIRLMDKQLNGELCRWEQHEKFCAIMKSVLWLYEYSLNNQTCERMFDYVVKLIERCSKQMKTYKLYGDYREAYNCAWDVLKRFPFFKYQSSLLHLIDLTENNSMPEEQCRLCEVMETVLRSHKDSLSHQIYQLIFDYLVKLIERSDLAQTVDSVWCVLSQFPFVKFQSFLQQLMNLMENKLNEDRHEGLCKEYKELSLLQRLLYGECMYDGWIKHRKLCGLLARMLEIRKDSFSRQTWDRMFKYLVKIIETCKDEETINRVWSALRQFPSFFSLLTTVLNSLPPDSHLHQCWCNAAKYLVKQNNQSNFWSQNNVDSTLNYLGQLFDHSNRQQTILCAIFLVEQLCLRKLIEENRLCVIKKKLSRHFHNKEILIALGLPGDFNSIQWCLDNLFENVDQNVNFSLVSLTSDRLGARCGKSNAFQFSHVFSSFGVDSKTFFYEITIFTNGEMRFGWSSEECQLDKFNGIGHDKHSIGSDASQKYIFHSRISTKMNEIVDCKPGDVIGCLIDVDFKQFVYFYNGIQISSYTHLSTSPYYATASLSPNQQCYFNFGQAQFKFPPKNIRFNNFHEVTNGDSPKYSLTETNEIAESFFLNNNQTDLFSQKLLQDIYTLIKSTKENNYRVENLAQHEFNKFPYIHNMQYMLTINNVTKELLAKDDKVDVGAQLIEKIIEDDMMLMGEMNLHKLIYPYLQMSTVQNEFFKNRMICIILSYLIKFSERYYDFIKRIRKEVFVYLIQILNKTSDKWAQLFAVIALKDLKLCDRESAVLQNNEAFIRILNTWKNNDHYGDAFKVLSSENCSPLDYQLYFVSEHFHNHMHNNSQVTQANPIALNCSDLTDQLYLSSDQFSARSDWKWQSVRSLCEVKKDVYYFEVVLLTNGPMRIGWSTKRTNLARTEVGGDEFSVGLDGYSRSLQHDSNVHHFSNVERWKARDVVSCLIDVTSKQFLFSLNGQPISSQSNFYFSALPYHASVSLSPHQQVYFNFGQSQFVFPPKRIDFWDFKFRLSYSKKLPAIDFNQANVNNSIISVNSTNTYGDISIKQLTPNATKSNCLSINHRTCIVLSPTLKSPQALTHTSADPSHDDPSFRRPRTKCQICFEQTSFKLLLFVCCNTLTLCLECLSQLRACPKCSRGQTINESTNNENQHLECRVCSIETTTKLLQFICCSSLVFCLDCLSQFKACPKCTRRIAK